MADINLTQFVIAIKAMETTLSGEAVNKALEYGLVPVLAEQKRMFGKYPRNTGPFPPWQRLAAATQRKRELHGVPPNQPLLISGHLRDSWHIVRDPEHGLPAIGSNEPDALAHEFGSEELGVTLHNGAIVPPRPTLQIAFWRKERQAFDRTLTFLEKRMLLKLGAMRLGLKRE